MADLFNDMNLFDDCDRDRRCPAPEICDRDLPKKAELTVRSILGGCANGEPLCNVPIKLYRIGGCKAPGIELVGCKFTDCEGIVKFRCLEPGEYAVEEVVNHCILRPEYYPCYKVVFCYPSKGFDGRLKETITILNELVDDRNFINFDAGCPCCSGPYNCGCGPYGYNNCGCNYGYNCGNNCGCNYGNSCGFNCGNSCGYECGNSCGYECGNNCGCECGNNCGFNCGNNCGNSCGCC